MQLPLLDRRGVDRLLLMAGIAFLFMAAFLYIVVPEGRVVFVVQRKPTFSKRDIVAIGLALVGVASLLSRSHMTAARHVVGLGFVGASFVWLLKDHPFQGPGDRGRARRSRHPRERLAGRLPGAHRTRPLRAPAAALRHRSQLTRLS